MAQGFRNVRVQVGVPGMAGYGGRAAAPAPSRRCTTSRCSSRPTTSAPRAEAVRSLPPGTGRRGRTAARHARARLAQPGGAVLQGRREVQAVLPGRSAIAGGHRVLPADPPAVRHAHRHGRAVQQPARMAAADRRAADRLHPRARFAGGRVHAGAQDRHSGGDLRREDGVARAGRRFAGRATWPT